MIQIDLYLLKKHQTFSDWFQKWFAKDNFFLAKICIVIQFFAKCLILLGALILDKWKAPLADILVIIVFTLALKGFFWWRVTIAEKEYKDAPTYKNNRLIYWLVLRHFFLIFELLFEDINPFLGCMQYVGVVLHGGHGNTAYLCIDAGGLLNSFAFLSMLYFGSCTPNPLKPSKFKEMISKLKEQLTRAPAELQPA